MLKLPKTSYQWALKHLVTEGDSDLFPAPFEIKAIKFNWKTLVGQLSNLDLSDHSWSGGRRFVVPKEKLAFRNATQLEPLDSLILTAIIKKYGNLIEKARIPVSENRVFSYRFDPTPDGRFYGAAMNSWHEFWENSFERANNNKCKWVAIADITDYYNQIYHHVLTNELSEAGLSKDLVRVIDRFLSNLTHGVSRGIPIGPHSTHLLAECALIPVDRSLLSHGFDFCRYVDDVHFFCSSRENAEIAIYDFANILDKQQRLTLQKQKTEILPAKTFIKRAESMLVDRPLNFHEANIISTISKHSDGNPYAFLPLSILSEEELETVSSTNLIQLFELYLTQSPVNYTRLGWLLRRLSQVGAPGAIDYLVKNIEKFTPVLGDLARYIMRASPNYSGALENVGQLILDALKVPLIEHSEYMQIILLNLFTTLSGLDQIDKLTAIYRSVPPSVKREIVVAASVAGHSHWIKERKDEFALGDPWLRRALISAIPSLPGDEAKHWLRKIKPTMSPMEKHVARWAFHNHKMKL